MMIITIDPPPHVPVGHEGATETTALEGAIVGVREMGLFPPPGKVGSNVGENVGATVGSAVGRKEGSSVGSIVGSTEGAGVGASEGSAVGM